MLWEGFVSRESNRIIFSGAELHADIKLGGLIASVGAGLDGKALKALSRGEMRGYDIAEYIHETSEEVLREGKLSDHWSRPVARLKSLQRQAKPSLRP